MKIHYLKLQNFRQYVDANIEFSTGQVERFTVIQGPNGAGKTNIMNAITWCLYGSEEHLSKTDSKKLPLLNEKLYHDMTAGSEQQVQVEIGLGREDVEYMISRTARVYRRLDGDYSLAADPDPTVLFLFRSNWKESEQPTVAVKSLLPVAISPFFFFDGEKLDRFFQHDSQERVKHGIVDVSQIDLLDVAHRHLERVNSDLMSSGTGIEEADQSRQEYQQAEQELKAAEKRLSELHEQLDDVLENIEVISRKLRESPEEEVRRLQTERDHLNEEIEDYEAEVNRLINEVSESLRLAGPIVYAHDAISETLAIILAKVKHGELPPKVREPFFRDLLTSQLCICGTELPVGSPARHNVEVRMEATLVDDYVNKAAEGRYRLEDMLEDLPAEIAKQRKVRGEIRNYEDAIREHNRRLKEISQKVGEYGEFNLEEVQVLEQQRNEFEEAKNQLNREIGATEKEKKDAKRKRDDAQKRYQAALKRDRKNRELLKRSQLCTLALKVLEQVRRELLSETREHIKAKTEAYFLNLIWKKATYKSVDIDKNYRLSVENIRGLPALGTLSAGERQVLALAFMAALRTISGFDAPIVIDTPTGRISSEPRENIAEVLPQYLGDTQATFLMTDTEYTDAVRVRLAKHVGKEYDLVFDEDEGVTHVMPR